MSNSHLFLTHFMQNGKFVTDKGAGAVAEGCPLLETLILNHCKYCLCGRRLHVRVCACVCVCVRACTRVCVRARVCVRVGYSSHNIHMNVHSLTHIYTHSPARCKGHQLWSHRYRRWMSPPNFPRPHALSQGKEGRIGANPLSASMLYLVQRVLLIKGGFS